MATGINSDMLLIEEATINPLSPLPSFLEMNMIDVTAQSGQIALRSSLDAVVERVHQLATTTTTTTSESANPTSATTHIAGESDNNRHPNSTISTFKATILSMLARLGRNYTPEIQMILTFLLERHALFSKSCATVAESVYSVKRCRMMTLPTMGPNGVQGQTKQTIIRPMSKQDKIISALCVSLVPYIKECMDRLYESHRERIQGRNSLHHVNETFMIAEEESSSSSVPSLLQRIKMLQRKLYSMFVTIYPFLHMTQEGMTLAYQFAYLIGRSVYYSPMSHVLGIVVRRTTMEDIQTQQQKQQQQIRQRQKQRGHENERNNTIASLPTATSSILNSNSNWNKLKPLKQIASIGIVSIVTWIWIDNIRNELRRNRRRWISRGIPTTSTTTTATSTSRTENGHEASSPSNNITNNSLVATARTNTNTVPIPTSMTGGTNTSEEMENILAIPPPLPPPLLSTSQSKLPSGSHFTSSRTTKYNATLCPLCHQKRINPVASTSGYVFCYRCLVMFIRETAKQCPLTGMACEESQIVRIYEQAPSSS